MDTDFSAVTLHLVKTLLPTPSKWPLLFHPYRKSPEYLIMASQPRKRRARSLVSIKGRVVSRDDAKPVIDATVIDRSSGRRAATKLDGAFDLIFENAPPARPRVLLVAREDYWPKTVTLSVSLLTSPTVSASSVVSIAEPITLHPFPDFLKKSFGVICAYFGPHLWVRWCLATK